MATEYIHVKIGLVDGVFPVLEFYTKWPFEGFYHYRSSPHETSWTHKQWCTPCLADGTPLTATDTPQPQHPDNDGESQTVSTDYRKFLSEHWDAEHNHCKVECLDEFYAIFRRAAANYINSIQIKHEQEIKRQHVLQGNHQHGGHEPRRADALLHPSGGQRSAASLPAGDTTKVRAEEVAAHRPKPVELSLFPDL